MYDVSAMKKNIASVPDTLRGRRERESISHPLCAWERGYRKSVAIPFHYNITSHCGEKDSHSTDVWRSLVVSLHPWMALH